MKGAALLKVIGDIQAQDQRWFPVDKKICALSSLLSFARVAARMPMKNKKGLAWRQP
jgi:hypothetical protein